jgi:hypothetical protein
MATFEYDVVIVGASFGGVAAALSAAAGGNVKVVLLESSDWVGGQATSQGCTRWDEAAAVLTESTGSPKSYRDVRHLIRARYEGKRSAMGLQQVHFNPGFAGVGPPFTTPNGQRKGHPFAADPQVVRSVFADALNEAGVEVKFGAAVTAADVHDGAVHGLTVGGDSYVGGVYVDATDLGDLLPLCDVRWVIGAESRADTGEQEAADAAHSEWVQPFTVPIALVWRPPGEDHRIPKPAAYDDIRRRQDFDRLKLPGPLGGEGDIRLVYNPPQESDTLFNYRQFIDPRNFSDGRPPRTTINVGSNDYLTRAIPTSPHSAAQDAQIVEEARAVSIAYAYYLQNDVPRDDGNGTGYPNLQVDAEAFGTADGTAPLPYIRESRRLANAWVRVAQNHIDAKTHGQRAQNFPDSCGIGWYAADVHQGWYATDNKQEDAATPNIGTPWHGIGTAPFQVPLGTMLPRELNNFVAACKNICATHLTSGAYRVHPVEWAIGEAAGVLASYCKGQGVTPGAVWNDAGRVTAYQRRLLARGTPIFWWDDVAFEDDERTFAAIQLLGVRGTFEGDGQTRNFDPDGDFPQAARDAIDQRENHQFDWPDGALTRAQAAALICEQLGLPL